VYFVPLMQVASWPLCFKKEEVLGADKRCLAIVRVECSPRIESLSTSTHNTAYGENLLFLRFL
jgi:hypothetical protein